MARLFFSLLLLAMPATAAAQTATSTLAEHGVRLDELNVRADRLQERIAQLLERVLLLRESVVVGSIAPTRGLIVHKDELGSSFDLEEVVYRLDGHELLNSKAQPGFAEARDFEVFNGPIAPGAHDLSVSMAYTGSGFGLFTYLKGYKFKVESRYKLMASEGRLTKLTVTSFAKKDITLEPKDRLAVRYDVEIMVSNTTDAR